MSNVNELDHESLLVLYEKTFDEIGSLREFEWKCAAAAVLLTGGTLALLTNEKVTPLLSLSFCSIEARWIVIGLQVMASAFGIWCMVIAHQYLTIQRQIRRDIEKILGFHEIDRFLPGSNSAVLPSQFQGKSNFKFQLFGLIIPLISLVCVMQLAAILVISKLK